MDGAYETDIGTNAACTKDGMQYEEEACANIEATRCHQSSHYIIPRRVESLPGECIGAESIVGEAPHRMLQRLESIPNGNEERLSFGPDSIGVVVFGKKAEGRLHHGFIRIEGDIEQVVQRGCGGSVSLDDRPYEVTKYHHGES